MMKPHKVGSPVPAGWELVPNILGWIQESLPPEPPKDGKDGVDGKDGRDGVDGKDGVDGRDGRDGVDGKDGRNGIDGKNGIGKDGRDGKDGIDGKDGVDGVGIKNIVTFGSDMEIELTNGNKSRHRMAGGSSQGTPFGGSWSPTEAMQAFLSHVSVSADGKPLWNNGNWPTDGTGGGAGVGTGVVGSTFIVG